MPRKSLGQHFLVDRRVRQRIVAALAASPDDTIVEVGAGDGNLTASLAEQGRRVIAVEIDEELCHRLRLRFQALPQVFIACTDVLSLAPSELLSLADASPPYVVVGNLPYYVGAAVVRHFLEAEVRPRRLAVMLQKEVAESMAAAPGHMSLLGVSVQLYGVPRIAFAVPPRAFYPPPKVTSALLVIDVREGPAVAVEDSEGFFQVVRAGFSAPRKQLHNTLAHGLGLERAAVASILKDVGLEGTIRPQVVSLEQWAALARAYKLWKGAHVP